MYRLAYFGNWVCRCWRRPLAFLGAGACVCAVCTCGTDARASVQVHCMWALCTEQDKGSDARHYGDESATARIPISGAKLVICKVVPEWCKSLQHVQVELPTCLNRCACFVVRPCAAVDHMPRFSFRRRRLLSTASPTSCAAPTRPLPRLACVLSSNSSAVSRDLKPP